MALSLRLLSTCGAVRGRYEEYRNSVYNDVMRSVQEVRKAAAEGVARMKESRSTAHLVGGDDPVIIGVGGEEVCDIQLENAQLNGLVSVRCED